MFLDRIKKQTIENIESLGIGAYNRCRYMLDCLEERIAERGASVVPKALWMSVLAAAIGMSPLEVNITQSTESTKPDYYNINKDKPSLATKLASHALEDRKEEIRNIAEIIRQEARALGLGEYANLFLAQFYVESRYDEKSLSPKNAYNVQQMRYIAFKDLPRMMSTINKKKRAHHSPKFSWKEVSTDPRKGIAAGIIYFGGSLIQSGYNVDRALAKYNAGPGKARSKRLPRQTREYKKRVMMLKRQIDAKGVEGAIVDIERYDYLYNYNRTAEIMFKSGSYKLAILYWEDLHRLVEDFGLSEKWDAKISWRLGECYHKLGRKDLAYAGYKRAIDSGINPYKGNARMGMAMLWNVD